MKWPRFDGAKLEPLLVREGAHHTCFGDGLCCSDMHVIGPIRLAERARLRVLHEGIVTRDPRDGVHALVMREETGTCIFQQDHLCALHEPLGGVLKPSACKRYPIALTATPEGGRITTEHSCTCRTLGERPPLTVEAALPSVRPGGRIEPALHVGRRVRYDRAETRSFREYRRDEEALLADVWASSSFAELERAFGEAAFPALPGGSWCDAVAIIDELPGHTRLEAALRWFRDAIVALSGGRLREGAIAASRPWAEAFDRAIARAVTEREPLEMVTDFAADRIWALDWVASTDFRRFRAGMATRVVVLQWLMERFRDAGARADRAAAEAICVVELSTASAWWAETVASSEPRRAG